MTSPYIFFGLAVLMAVLIPLVPRMVQIRIAVLRKLHFHRMADFHERHGEGIVWAVRGILAVLAVVLVWAAFARSNAAP
jgi:hypothetical protein